MAATEKFDMIPVREKQSFDPQPWDGTENVLPGKVEDGGYFLRNGEGGKVVTGGVITRALASRKETDGRFSIYCLEASSLLAEKGGLGREVQFEDTHHAIYTVDGIVKLNIDGSEVRTTVGETTFVPAGTKWSFEAGSVYARAYVFANGGGIGEVLTSVGSKYEFAGVPAEVENWDESELKSLEAELKFTM